VLFKDFKIAAKILHEKNPRKIKSLGREVSGFFELRWREHCLDVVKEGNIAKVTINIILL